MKHQPALVKIKKEPFSGIPENSCMAFWLILGELTFTKSMELLKWATVKAGFNVFSYFLAIRYAYVYLVFPLKHYDHTNLKTHL